MILVVLAALAFVLGSIPSGLVIVYLGTGRDIRRHGSGNIGASNVHSEVGRAAGIAVGVLDMAKGVLSVLVGRGFGLDHRALAVLGLAAVLGHDFSFFLHFRGGKGVATSFGVALVLAPIPAILAMLLWVAALFGSRYASVASLTALAALPILFLITRVPSEYVLLGITLFVLAAAKHRENLIRLARGTEISIDQRRMER